MGKVTLRFKKNPRYPHKRSEGLTRRGEARQERLMLGNNRKPTVVGVAQLHKESKS